MRSAAHVTEYLDSYSLGCLERGEARMVARHLRSCPACRRELSRWEAVTARLSYAAPEREPPRGLESRLLARYRAEHDSSARAMLERFGRSLLRPVVAPAAMAALMVLAIGLGGLAARLAWKPPAESWTSVAAGSMEVSLRATALSSGAHGTVLFRASEETGLLAVAGLQAPPRGSSYRLWMYRDDEPMDGGTFSVDALGTAVKSVSAPYPLSECRLFVVTLEPSIGRSVPTGLVVLTGTFTP